MTLIPKSHPRAKSLLIREKLVNGFDNGLVAKEGLLAQGRGEAFDYLLGEKTGKAAKQAIKAAAAQLLLAEIPVISVNGNIAALCPKQIVRLSKQIKAKLEVNLFYTNKKRQQAIIRTLKKNGAREVLGTSLTSSTKLSGIDSARRIVDKNGIKIIGERNILNKLPVSASNLYAKNVFNFISNLYDKDNKKLKINLEDEIISKTLLK